MEDDIDLKNELSKDFYNPLYLSKMHIKEKQVDVSVIIPTYNRAPYSKNSKLYKYNPIYLSIKSLILQKAPPKEIVVIDDGSNDNTQKVVEDLKKEAYSSKGIEIRYIVNEKNLGSSVSRNIGSKLAKGKYLYFLDDDCVVPPYLLYISKVVIEKLEKEDNRFAVLVLPFYNRDTFPSKIQSIDTLSSTFTKRNDNGSVNLTAFVKEYLYIKNKFMNKNLKILKPVRVFQTWGHFIIKRDKYLDVGGFPEFATWPNKAGEEQEFACRLVENGYSLYYLPDPKAAAYHGSYGARISSYFRGYDWLLEITKEELSLKKFTKVCNKGIVSGNRVGVDEYCYSKIISVFCIIYKRNIKEAIKFAKYSYESFVEKGEEKWFGMYPYDKIKDKERREEIWHKAINDGLNLLLNYEKKKIKKLNEFIESLKRKGKIEEEKQKKTALKFLRNFLIKK